MNLNLKYLDLLARFVNDILFFCFVVFPHHFSLPAGRFHREIFQFLTTKPKYACIVAPRGHTKSTSITLGYVLHEILFAQRHFILIIADTYTQSEMFLDAIKKELETNWIIKLLFGSLVGEQWGEGEITTLTDIKIVAKGTGMKLRGLKYKQYRPDLIVCDDLENEELVANPERREKTERWFYGSVIPSMADDGRLIVVGTILHYDSLLMKLSKNPQFQTLFYKAVMDGKPLWEAKFSLESLEALKDGYRSQGLLDVFYCEYMNEPISDENRIFKQSYFKYFDDDKALYDSLSRFITVDLAISQKETADYNVIMVCGVDGLNQIYVIEYSRMRGTPGEVINELFRLVEKHKVLKVGIESVAYQRALIWFVQEEMRKRNRFFLVEELKADTDKERRIKGLQPRYASGSVFHKANMTELEEELMLFPKSPHDDVTDALAYLPQIAFPGKTTTDLNKKRSGREEAEQHYDNNIYTQF